MPWSPTRCFQGLCSPLRPGCLLADVPIPCVDDTLGWRYTQHFLSPLFGLAELVLVVIRARLVAATFRNRLRPFHHQRAAIGADAPCGPCFDGVFTCRVIRTREKDAESPAAFHHLAVLAERTCDAGFATRFFCRVFPNEFALRIITASDESTEAPLAFHEFAALAFRTRFADIFGRRDLAPVFFACAEALWETLATHEAPRFRELVDHFARSEEH